MAVSKPPAQPPTSATSNPAVGATGSGKPAASSGDRGIIADPDGAHAKQHYNPARGDVIFNPFDKPSVQWNLKQGGNDDIIFRPYNAAEIAALRNTMDRQSGSKPAANSAAPALHDPKDDREKLSARAIAAVIETSKSVWKKVRSQQTASGIQAKENTQGNAKASSRDNER